MCKLMLQPSENFIDFALFLRIVRLKVPSLKSCKLNAIKCWLANIVPLQGF